MTHEQRLALKIAISVAVVWAVVTFGILCLRGCLFRAGQAFVDTAGPGNSDYSMDIIEDFALFRCSRRARSVIRWDGPSKGGGTSWVDEDVTSLGWDERFIVCYQGPPRAGSRTATKQTRFLTGWWIIDTETLEKHGPFDKEAYLEKMQQLGFEEPIPAFPTPVNRWSPVCFGPGELHQRKLE